MKGRIYMSEKELDRVEIFKKVINGRMKQSKASKILGLSARQVKRIKKRFKTEGVKGLSSKKVGKKGNRQLALSQKMIILEFFKQEDHRDFGPTLAHEYLTRQYGLKASISSVRATMIEYSFWDPNNPSY